MKTEVRPIGQWRPTWKWFKLGLSFESHGLPRFMFGLGLIALEAHYIQYGNKWFEFDIYLDSPLGYTGVQIEFEESEVQE